MLFRSDNGVVAVVIGKLEGNVCSIILWLMSCRVLRRDMEVAMMDEFVRYCKERGVKVIHGCYYPTAKNRIVADFYDKQGFTLDSEDKSGRKYYSLDVDKYQSGNHYIEVAL